MARHIVTRSSGNVFTDIGVNEPEDALKAQLVSAIRGLIESRELTQTAAAARINVAQPDLSKLLRGKTAGFSLERLLGFVRDLGGDVEIKLSQSAEDRKGHLKLLEAA